MGVFTVVHCCIIPCYKKKNNNSTVIIQIITEIVLVLMETIMVSTGAWDVICRRGCNRTPLVFQKHTTGGFVKVLIPMIYFAQYIRYSI